MGYFSISLWRCVLKWDLIVGSFMNKQEWVLSQFGAQAKWGHGGNEINGLSADAIPKNVVSSFVRERERDRVFHLVEDEKCIAVMRVCAAMPGSGYDAFSVVHAFAQKEDRQDADKVRKFFRRWGEFGMHFGPDTSPTLANARSLGRKDVPEVSHGM